MINLTRRTLTRLATTAFSFAALPNEGVGLAPFHDFEGSVDPELQTQLDEIREAIIAGEITVESPASP